MASGVGIKPYRNVEDGVTRVVGKVFSCLPSRGGGDDRQLADLSQSLGPAGKDS